MVKLTLIFIAVFLLHPPISRGTNYRIPIDILYLDASSSSYSNVQPGDTLSFEAGDRDYLLIKGFKGEAGKPIVMMNAGGQVIIDTDHYFGISIQNCQYIKFTGTGDKNYTYGFAVKRVANGSGMGIGYLSSDFEIDHISIENTLIAGIYAKTDPDCTYTSVRGVFTQYNTVIHDNYIAYAGNEGLYVGSTKYTGQNVSCDGIETLMLPSLLDGVKIYNNIIKYSGWDGIQVSSASNNCQIYNNTIMYDSQSQIDSQMSGIIIGGGTRCDCYNNFIYQGNGDGIECHGLGGTWIYNNIIVGAGSNYQPDDQTKMKHGIFVSDVSVENDSTFFILNNDIINPKSDGIRFSSVKSKNNIIKANVMVNPGNYDYYQNGNTSYDGMDSYIMLTNTASNVITEANYLTRDLSSAGFVSNTITTAEDLKISAESPLIDGTETDAKITFDFFGQSRPNGTKSDIGAIEYDGVISSISTAIPVDQGIIPLQNPVKDFLEFKIPQDFNTNISIIIYNLYGQEVITSLYTVEKGAQSSIKLNLSNINTGVYIYKIASNNMESSGKFIKH